MIKKNLEKFSNQFCSCSNRDSQYPNELCVLIRRKANQEALLSRGTSYCEGLSGSAFVNVYTAGKGTIHQNTRNNTKDVGSLQHFVFVRVIWWIVLSFLK